MEKRKQQQEALKANRIKAAEEATVDESQDTSMLDDLLSKLMSGDAVVGRRVGRNRRARPGAAVTGVPAALTLSGEGTAADIAKDMLAQMGVHTKEPMSPRAPRQRRQRIRRGSNDELIEPDGDDGSVGPFSPTPSTFEISEDPTLEEEEPSTGGSE